jgi:prepilin-type N-terminal cleavage/methylation domain-containing protein
MMKKSNKKGFTLVELIVVIAIMAILAAVLVPTVTNKIDDANKSAAKSDIQSAAKAISLYIAENETVTRATIEALPEVVALSNLAGSYSGAITYDPAATTAGAETVMTITLKKGDNIVSETDGGLKVEVKLGKGI